MPRFDHRPKSFQYEVQGSWGEFSSPGGTIRYVLTSARLAPDATDPEARLTQHLRPVREVLDIEDMRFSELLQRDLDDHRVSTELVPYLLGVDPETWAAYSHKPAFFPPILAFLLPFDSAGNMSQFPQDTETDETETSLGWMREEVTGEAYRFRYAIDPDQGSVSDVKFGTLEWNSERGKLVVLDGQHRAMAMLAIDRTLRNTWQQATFTERYAPFYEERVRNLLSLVGRERVDDLRLPVAVCWFPGVASPIGEARKLFVDVNKNAKAPSRARLVLLSDSELDSVFTQTLLNRLRGEGGQGIPLYAVEYDNPDPSSSTRPGRWSTLLTLDLLRDIIDSVVSGDPKYIEDVETKISGKPNEAEKATRLRRELRVEDRFSEEIEDDGSVVYRDQITNIHFPSSQLNVLQAGFLEGWGESILTVLSSVLPYYVHCEALRALRATWPRTGADVSWALAHEALFEGAGLFWTLRSNSEFHRRRDGGGEPPATVNAWDLIAEKEKQFRRERATRYLGSESEESVAQTEAAFQVVNTHAAMLGLFMLLATLADYEGILGGELPQLADAFSRRINRGLDGEAMDGRTRRLVFNKSELGDAPALNLIATMNTPRFREFRYLWLEVLWAPEDDVEGMWELVDRQVVNERRHEARRAFYTYRVEEEKKALRQLDRSRTRAEHAPEARRRVREQLRAALEYWFGIPADDVESSLPAEEVMPGEGEGPEDEEYDEEEELGADVEIGYEEGWSDVT